MKVHTKLVLGARDLEANAISVRQHGKGNLGAKPVMLPPRAGPIETPQLPTGKTPWYATRPPQRVRGWKRFPNANEESMFYLGYRNHARYPVERS